MDIAAIVDPELVEAACCFAVAMAAFLALALASAALAWLIGGKR